MASSPLGFQGNNRGGETISSETRPASQPTRDRELLDSVLRWTETTLQSGEPLEAAELEAIREIARRHPGSPMVLDPIVVDLVRAVLHDQFRGHPGWFAVCESACRAVAETLFEDHVSRERLQVLWSRLVRGER